VTSPLLASIDRVHEGAPHRVKDEEKALLYREICTGKLPTRQGLARRLDIRPSSVSEAVQELVDDGLVLEEQARPKGKTGRPQLILSPRADRFVAISVYVDSRELKGVLVTLQEEVLAEEVRTLPESAGNREISAAVIDLLKRLRARAPAGTELAGAGLSLPGTVNSRTRTWVRVARWPKLSDLDFTNLEGKIDFPVVLRRMNEAELAYFLDCTPRARAGTTLLLHWGFGIGSAAAFHGELLTSSLGRFGEIGHARIGADVDAPCLCGLRGCLETVAALWSLLPSFAEAMGDLPEDERELAPILGNPRLLALPQFEKALSAVTEALVLLSVIFFPDTVLLAGPFTENPALLRRLSDRLRRALPDYARDFITITAIPGGMPGCRRGGANPIFRQALARALRRRT
jgi:predicted NBD/HSP70 family sugar kinase